MIATFCLIVDLDRWDEKGKGFIRVKINRVKIEGPELSENSSCLIISKEDLEENAGYEDIYLRQVFVEFWMHIGEVEFKKKLNKLLAL